MKDKKLLKKYLIIALIIVAIATVSGFYIGSQESRDVINKTVFKTEVTQADAPRIELDQSTNSSVYAYGSRVAVLSGNKLTIYNNKAEKEKEIEVVVNQAKFATAGNYLLLADAEGSNVYLIHNGNLQWKKTIDGQTSQVCVTEKGAVGISMSGTTYKSVIIMYGITGQELFRSYLASATVTDLDISNDGKYLSYVEISTSGLSVVSMVKTISVDKAKQSSSESILYTYSSQSNELVLKIKQNGSKVVEFKDTGIFVCDKGEENKILEIPTNSGFADIDLNGYAYKLVENIDGENSELTVQNVNTTAASIYTISEAVISMYCSKSMIAINIGNEVLFVNARAWPSKKYVTDKNISDIVMGDQIAAIIYKDSVSIVKL